MVALRRHVAKDLRIVPQSVGLSKQQRHLVLDKFLRMRVNPRPESFNDE
jgi:hypothetical protein